MRRSCFYTLTPILLCTSLGFASDLPRNARLQIRLNQMLSSSCISGQTIQATLDRAVSRAGLVILPRGSSVEGVVTCQTPNGYQPERMDIVLLSVKANGKIYSILTNTITEIGNPPRDPKTGRTVRDEVHKSEATRAAIETTVASATNQVGDLSPTTPSSTLPTETPEVRSGTHVILLPGSRLTFTLFSGKSLEPSPN